MTSQIGTCDVTIVWNVLTYIYALMWYDVTEGLSMRNITRTSECLISLGRAHELCVGIFHEFEGCYEPFLLCIFCSMPNYDFIIGSM